MIQNARKQEGRKREKTWRDQVNTSGGAVNKSGNES